MSRPAHGLILGAVLASLQPGCYADRGLDSPVLAIEPIDDELIADGVDHVLLRVIFAGGTTAGLDVGLSTSLGVLDPSATSAEAQRAVTLKTDGSAELLVPLYAGRTPGTAVVEAEVAGARALQTVSISPALPTRLAVAADPVVLDGSTRTTDLDVQLLRAFGGVSTGVQVWFEPCCDALAEAPECGRFISVPQVVVATETEPARVRARAELTARGRAYVAGGGMEPDEDGGSGADGGGTTETENVTVEVVVYVLDGKTAELPLGCDELRGAMRPAGVAVVGRVAVDLIR